MDSDASHHVTGDLTNLSHHQPYEGLNDILLGDGSGLEIAHTGSSKLPAPSKSFCLSNVLCVLSIRQNLISVSKFCKTNNASIEFFFLLLLSRISKRGHVSLKGRERMMCMSGLGLTRETQWVPLLNKHVLVLRHHLPIGIII